ncbi:MAG TPA: glycosyltransferase family 4 protein [Mycobacteriales bacterium]|nr:glycosyltransferase family 4 protein [Mycobacteriales bacterium]
MRILHVNKFLHRRGGAESYMEGLAGLQQAAGHDVAFFGMQHPDNPEYPYQRHFPEYIEFEPPPPGIGKARSFGRMVWSTSAARGMDAVIAEFRPDVVHLHNIYHQISPSVLRPIARHGVAAVMTLHDYKLACPTYQLTDHGRPCTACVDGGPFQAVKRNCHGSRAGSAAAAIEVAIHRAVGAYAPVQRFLCPSEFLAGIMERAGVYPERLRVQENFVDLGTVPAASGPGRNAVYFGRLSPEKGVDVLIRAWADLPGVLQVAGDGPARTQLRELAGAVAPGRVRFHGRLDAARLHALVREAAVAVAPSIWYENQPLSVLEAFACGRPVVATDLGGMPELIDPDGDGMLVPPGDPAALADTLRPLLSDPERAHLMGRLGREKVEKRFDPETHLAAVTEHYLQARRDRGASR